MNSSLNEGNFLIIPCFVAKKQNKFSKYYLSIEPTQKVRFLTDRNNLESEKMTISLIKIHAR